ncbi:MAG: phenylalanine--tRNA ligase subunit beta [Xanthomonadaceae bacterium]|jgi:phenylalanyl-tRNA synthetase beta chain|nr:phenylalanine--tRNA ligase subunit beta [Xanthomonadaceae bacterium]
MKFSDNWLRSLVRIDADRATLCRRLTMAGLEVEGVEVLGEGLGGVVVGEIVSAERHPHADKLQVCRVSTGQGEPLQIVCGAPNARVGLKAPLATIGATLPNGMAIRQAALRGVESHGMLCSAKELALDGDAAGLLELPADAPVGAPLSQWLGLPDAAIEIKLTPNRPDCLGMAGLAAEVATLFDAARVAWDEAPAATTSQAARAVRIASPADCPRYLGRVVEGIDPAAPTPVWMAERLRRAGVRPISAVVDCTNYVMLELGQPMHAFDHDRLRGGVVVRRAAPGESAKLLDEREVALDPGFLVIADDGGPVAVAGVMGGWDSRVTDATRSVFLEAAHFAPAAIIGRARRLGLHTDASHRFERGVDPGLPRRALERLTQLLLSIVGGQAGPVVAAEHPEALPPTPTIRLRAARLARVLGMDVPRERVGAILAGLGMRVTADADGWTVQPPSARFDIAIEEDLIEEVVRVHGYEQVPVRIPTALLQVETVTETRVEASALRRALVARGYAECIDFAFVPAGTLADWGLADGAVALANPLSADLAVMRTALLPGLVEAARRNLARQQARLRLFEFGRVFHAATTAGAGPIERDRLAGVVLGRAVAEHWDSGKRAADFFDLKGDVEALLALAAADDVQFVAGGPAWLHPGRSATVLRSGSPVGWVGVLHPRLQALLDLGHDPLVFELDLDPLCRRSVPRANDLSRFPSVRRDIAMVLPQGVAWAAVEACARQAAGPALRALHLFDEYIGTGLKPDTRSLAIGLILQDDSRTLTDADADAAVGAVVAALGRDFAAVLRS